jgi:hypothetical protein
VHILSSLLTLDETVAKHLISKSLMRGLQVTWLVSLRIMLTISPGIRNK